jgi:hypothetical protein
MIHTFASLYAISTGANQALQELLTEFNHRARSHPPTLRCTASGPTGSRS